MIRPSLLSKGLAGGERSLVLKRDTGSILRGRTKGSVQRAQLSSGQVGQAGLLIISLAALISSLETGMGGNTGHLVSFSSEREGWLVVFRGED